MPVIMVCPADAEPVFVGRSAFLSKPVADEALVAALAQLDIATPGRSLALVSADESLAATVTRVTEREHWKSSVVPPPTESLDVVARLPADAIVFDLGSSVHTGMELVQRLRVSEHTRRVPLIVVASSQLTPSDRLIEGGYLELEVPKGDAAETYTTVAQLVSACVGRTTQLSTTQQRSTTEQQSTTH